MRIMISPALPPGCSEIAAGQSIGCVTTANGSDGDGIGRAAAAEAEVKRLDAAAFWSFGKVWRFCQAVSAITVAAASSRFQRPTSAKAKLEGPGLADAPLNL